MNRRVATLVFVLAVVVMFPPAVLRADTPIYNAFVSSGSYVPFTDDGTPNRPTGAFIGNTITFDPSLWAANDQLDSVLLDVGTDTGGGTYTMYLYSGSDPGTGTLLATSSAFVGHSGNPATFSFDLLVPETVTFIVTSNNNGVGSTCTSSGTCAGVITSPSAPTLGSSSTDGVWYGDISGNTFSGVQNSIWAINDGDVTNTFAAEFFGSAAVPEPLSPTLLATMLAAVGFVIRTRKNNS
jgi:hypothetical protein